MFFDSLLHCLSFFSVCLFGYHHVQLSASSKTFNKQVPLLEMCVYIYIFLVVFSTSFTFSLLHMLIFFLLFLFWCALYVRLNACEYICADVCVCVCVFLCECLSFDSVSHKSVGRTKQTISEYKSGLNSMQAELFDSIFISISLVFMHWMITKSEWNCFKKCVEMDFFPLLFIKYIVCMVESIVYAYICVCLRQSCITQSSSVNLLLIFLFCFVFGLGFSLFSSYNIYYNMLMCSGGFQSFRRKFHSSILA